MNGIVHGFGGFLRAFGFMLRHRMAWMFLVPALLWIVLAYGLFTLLEGPAALIGEWLAQWLGVEVVPATEAETSWWNTAKSILNSTREVLVWIALKLITLFVLFTVNKYLVLILLSPLLAYASERAEEILTGRSFPFSWAQLSRDAVRGSLLALRNGTVELFAAVLIGIVGLVLPILLPANAVLLFLLSAYFYGFSMIDYVLERRKLRVVDSVHVVNDHLGPVIGNGMAFSMLMKIPLLGTMLAPLLGAVGVVLALEREGALQRIPHGQ
ncbi:MAG: EI24 domain-containing protein [Flavobacteriales bacterium]|nr:EI24 domain-containing protein [Flavobacteriales bacterium]